MPETRPNLYIIKSSAKTEHAVNMIDKALKLFDPILEPALGPLVDSMLNDYPPHDSNVIPFVSIENGKPPNNLKNKGAILREVIEDRLAEAVFWTTQKINEVQDKRRKRRLRVIR